jgi:hypothetical protein
MKAFYRKTIALNISLAILFLTIEPAAAEAAYNKYAGDKRSSL